MTNSRKIGIIIIEFLALAVISGLAWFLVTLAVRNVRGTPTLTAVAEAINQNCTYSITYWMNHPEKYPVQLVIGEQVYNPDEIRSVLASDSADITEQLRRQLIVTFLNYLAGADQNPVGATIIEAYSWLVTNPPGSPGLLSVQEMGSELLNQLEVYNEGSAGVNPCQGTSPPTVTMNIVPTQTPTATPTQTTTWTSTPTIVISLTPGPTLTPAYSPTSSIIQPTPTRPGINPTYTRTPTNEPTDAPTRTQPSDPPTPTWTLDPPTPTLTPLPTMTEPVEPTDIPEPTITATSVIEPTATAKAMPRSEDDQVHESAGEGYSKILILRKPVKG